MTIQNRKTRIHAILHLMNRLNCRWVGERVTYKMFTKQIDELVKDIKNDKDAKSMRTGGLRVKKDENTLVVSFEITIDFLEL